MTDDVARISWTAKTAGDALPDAQFDDFSILVKLPAAPGKLYWAVNQVCEQGRMDWVEVPQIGQAATVLKAPAAVLEVLPAAPAQAGEHKH